MDLVCLKLMLQPLVENAIYHGMEFMDGDGEVCVKGRWMLMTVPSSGSDQI